jgi:hypothetical protein
MQTLGLSDSTPRTESRLKSLFWPSIETGNDVDYLGSQGLWVCTVVAVVSLSYGVVSDHPITGVAFLLFYYLGGIGVRERNRYAATIVLVTYLADTLLAGFNVVRVILLALLLSNLRATWIASGWNAWSENATLPPRLDATWGDKLADQLPKWLWPRIQILYYIFSVGFLLLLIRGLLIASVRGTI